MCQIYQFRIFLRYFFIIVYCFKSSFNHFLPYSLKNHYFLQDDSDFLCSLLLFFIHYHYYRRFYYYCCCLAIFYYFLPIHFKQFFKFLIIITISKISLKEKTFFQNLLDFHLINLYLFKLNFSSSLFLIQITI